MYQVGACFYGQLLTRRDSCIPRVFGRGVVERYWEGPLNVQCHLRRLDALVLLRVRSFEGTKRLIAVHSTTRRGAYSAFEVEVDYKDTCIFWSPRNCGAVPRGTWCRVRKRNGFRQRRTCVFCLCRRLASHGAGSVRKITSPAGSPA